MPGMDAATAARKHQPHLPLTLRSLIASRIGVPDEQIILGAGATGVVMQVLHAVTSPGDWMVLTSPTFDGFPISRRWRGWYR
jgi:histidinol-phosphate aminotransferase